MVHVLRQRWRRRDRRSADDHQRSGRSGGDARGARRAARGAGRRAGAAAVARSPSRRRARTRSTSARWPAAVARAVADGFTHVAFGDLFLEDVRRYREEQLAGTGLTPLFPLFGADTAPLAREMIAGGLRRAHHLRQPEGARPLVRRPRVRCRAARRTAARPSIPAASAASSTPSRIAGPMFSQAIPIESGIVVERDGFVFADLTNPANAELEAEPGSRQSPDRQNEPLSRTHRLPDRGNDRDAVPPRAGRSHRRRVRLHRASAGGAAEAEGLGVHQRAVRQDRGAAAGSGARVLRSAGRSRRRAGPARHRRRDVQPAIGRRDPADDPDARRPGRLSGRRPSSSPTISRPISSASANRPSRFRPRLRAFFEEWDDPLISGIRWVEELVRSPAATPIFPELADARLAKDRIVDPAEVARRDPEVIFASWCGKKVNVDRDHGSAPGGTRSARCATTASSRSSRPTSCSPVRRA